MPRPLLLLLLFFFALSTNMQAQMPMWRSVGAEQGMPDPVVSCFEQLDDGRLLIGSPTGIMIQEGSSIQYLLGPKQLPKTINPFIYQLAHKGNTIWAITRNSVLRYDLETHKLHFLLSAITASTLYQFCLTPDSSQLAVLSGAAIYFFNTADTSFRLQRKIVHRELFHRIEYYDGELLLSGYNHIAIGTPAGFKIVHQGEWRDAVWWPGKKAWLLATANGLKLWRSGQAEIQMPVKADYNHLTRRYCIQRADDNEMWLCFENGLARLAPAALDYIKTDSVHPNSPASYRFNKVFKNRYGTLFIGGDNFGYSYLTRGDAQLGYISTGQLHTRVVWTLYADEHKQELFAGTNEGVRYGRMHPNGFEELKLYNDGSGGRFAISGILPVSPKQLLVLTYGRGAWLLNRTTQQLEPFAELNRHLADLRINHALLCNNNTQVLVYGTENTLLFDLQHKRLVKQLREVNANAIAAFKHRNTYYIGRSGLGLIAYDSLFNYVATYACENDAAGKNMYILSLAGAGADELLVGTMGVGLYSFSTRSHQYTPVTLPGNPANIYTMQQLPNGNYILGANTGLIYYNHRTGAASCLNTGNVLPFNDFNQNATFAGKHKLYFGGEKGIVCWNKSATENLFKSTNALQAFHEQAAARVVHLPAHNRLLEMQVSLGNQVYVHTLPLAYKLVGLEDNYHTLQASAPSITYNYLAQGEYDLEVKVADENNYIQAAPLHISIVVEPFFYETRWFKIITGLLAFILVLLLMRFIERWRIRQHIKRLEAEQKIAQERVRISRELHDNVGSQLTYLITGLETSELLLDKNKTDVLKNNLEDLQLTARESIQQLRQSIWALQQEEIPVPELVNQFKQWSARMLQHQLLSINVHVQSDTGKKLPPIAGLNVFRMMQELVNNTIKHARATEIDIDIRATPTLLTITFKDDGIGFDTANRESGNGLHNLEHRAGELGGRVEVNSSPGQGTEVVIEVPLE